MDSTIRAQFPFLTHHPHISYLDNAATTQKPQSVIDTVASTYEQGYGNISRGSHQFTRNTTKQFETARKTVGEFIHTLSSHEIVFTSGSTEGINIIANALKSRTSSDIDLKGSTFLLTTLEHHSNLLPWQRLAKQKDATLTYLPLTNNFTVDLSALQKIVAETTVSLVTISQVSNVTGTVQPVRKIVEIVKEKHPHALIITDASQSIGHMSVNVQQLKTDFLVFSAHKMYGPTGVGVLYGREHLLTSFNPYRLGGGMVRDVTLDSYNLRPIPMRLEAGTPNIAGVIGLSHACTWINTIGREQIADYEVRLADILHYQLSSLSIDGLTILGNNKTDRTGIISFYINDIDSEDIANYLDDDGILVRSGHHCAKPAHLELFGTDSSVRVSFGIYNTENDVEQLVKSLKRAVRMLRS